MDCKVIWTEPSLDDLFRIVSYIAQQDDEASRRVGFDLVETVELLKRFPLLGPPYPRGADGNIREIVCWKYRIFYRITAEKRLVEILTIWHGSRGEPKL